MNSDAPITPREELEARLTALLLGELSAEEAATLRAIMKIDPQLAAAYERLRATIGLVREATHKPSAQTATTPEPVRLAENRRKVLLAHFKTITPPQFRPEAKRGFSWLIPAAAAAAVVLLFIGGMVLPTFSKANSRASVLAVRRSSIAEADRFDRAYFEELRPGEKHVSSTDDETRRRALKRLPGGSPASPEINVSREAAGVTVRSAPSQIFLPAQSAGNVEVWSFKTAKSGEFYAVGQNGRPVSGP